MKTKIYSLLTASLLMIACDSAPDGMGQTDSVLPQLTHVQTLATGGQTEIIHYVPGQSNKLMFINSNRAEIGLVTLENDTFRIDEKIAIDVSAIDVGEAGITAIYPYVGGEVALVNRLDPDVDQNGSVLFVDVANNKGAILREVEVGIGPDSIWVTKDGQWAVVAAEAQEADSQSGSVAIIDISQGVENASVKETIELNDIPGAQPESVVIGPDDNTVLVSVQEQAKLVVFELTDPTGTLTVIDLPAVAKPDGVAISQDGAIGASANERGDSISVIDMVNRTVLVTHPIVNDVPLALPRNRRGGVDPEGVILFEFAGINYLLVALEDAGSVLYYSLEDPSAPAYLGWAPVGNSRKDSKPEGIDIDPNSGAIFTANEGDGTLSLLVLSSATSVTSPTPISEPEDTTDVTTLCPSIDISGPSSNQNVVNTGVVINEFMASNDTAVVDPDDPDDGFDDWLELYNGTTEVVDLSGWRLSDSAEEPSKYVFPNGVTIAARGFLVIWADDEVTQGNLHAAFKLGSGGEEIILSTDQPNEVADILQYEFGDTDVSYGRTEDGGATWGRYVVATPGNSNSQSTPTEQCPVN